MVSPDAGASLATDHYPKHSWDARPPNRHVVPARNIEARDDFWDARDAVYAMGCEFHADHMVVFFTRQADMMAPPSEYDNERCTILRRITEALSTNS
ncbi:hypothetical protein BV22DRAFT_1038836 [Leucogyrophana mollusca]|uniref:Uncharacterized protein n=1 Tax=Leucogyrophana mollusca TaxID=85980 RepID=A0ACB8B6R6_9AGAM|nr:hypothetical protein BV22DRAFT_1038836 [Leucogyrophana mollusca]